MPNERKKVPSARPPAGKIETGSQYKSFHLKKNVSRVTAMVPETYYFGSVSRQGLGMGPARMNAFIWERDFLSTIESSSALRGGVHVLRLSIQAVNSVGSSTAFSGTHDFEHARCCPIHVRIVHRYRLGRVGRRGKRSVRYPYQPGNLCPEENGHG